MCRLYIHFMSVCIYIKKHVYIYTCMYKSIAVTSSLGVNRISHNIKHSQELKYFAKSDPQQDSDY